MHSALVDGGKMEEFRPLALGCEVWRCEGCRSDHGGSMRGYGKERQNGTGVGEATGKNNGTTKRNGSRRGYGKW